MNLITKIKETIIWYIENQDWVKFVNQESD